MERELHLASADPSSESTESTGVSAGEDAALAGGDDGADEALLTDGERERLERLRANFRAFVSEELANYRAVAIEEAFSVEVGGVSVQGRIDAVFERVSGDGPRYLVVDWKSGRPVTATTKPDKVAYFVTQLRLYRACVGRPHGCGRVRGGGDGGLPGGSLAPHAREPRGHAGDGGVVPGRCAAASPGQLKSLFNPTEGVTGRQEFVENG